jgi:uncharacterized membrane protein
MFTDIKKPSLDYYFLEWQKWTEKNLWLILFISALWLITGTIGGLCVVALLLSPLVIKKLKSRKNVSNRKL